ncbi:MAG TPA: hypothetical protein P5549_05450 [Syntrophomonas sp.]|jgi:hypothetical protein|nr:hypothetical protein [Syntrophomonas sp.]
MGTAKAIKINYHTKAAYEMASSLPCPRSAHEVYNVGVSLQYCIRAKYLEIAELLNDKTYLTDQAAQQLVIKSKIAKLAAFRLNVQLNKFYELGGPIMEDPVSKEMAKDIQPFFKRIMSRFLQSLDESSSRLLTKQISTEEMTAEVKQQITDVYTVMEKLFPVDEITSAFDELIEVLEA